MNPYRFYRSRFQFLYGSIEVFANHIAFLFQHRFNSYMVRLRSSPANAPIPAANWVSIPIWFDWGWIVYESKRKCFVVSIPIWFDWGSNRSKNIENGLSFNSYMVRLRLFQRLLPTIEWFCFNSYMVRLRLPTRNVPPTRASAVSIPIWFDWGYI